MKKNLLLVSLAMFLIVPLQALGGAAGEADGKFMIDKDVVQIKHSYAYLQDNAEGWADGREVRILLTESPVEPGLMEDAGLPFKLRDLAKQGKLRGVLISFDPEKRGALQISGYYPGKELKNNSISKGDQSPIDGLVLTDKNVKGRIQHHTDAHEDFGWPAEDYDISFDAPLLKPPSVTATLTGEKARKAPQTTILLTKLTAFVKGDMKRVRECGTDNSNRELDVMLEKAGKSEMAQFRQMIKDEINFIKKGKLRLVERGENATLIISKDGGKSMFKFVKINGKWKSD